jgi:steroid delta-isomerase-like uncharacterized protein
MSQNADILLQFIERVWNTGDLAAVDEFIGDAYTIHSDPGDPWEGCTLTRDGFKERLARSRGPFPDLRFEIHDLIDDGSRIVICWTMRATQTGPLAGRPATGKSISVRGMTLYHFSGGRIVGHHQVVDRLAVVQQLGLAR